MNAVPANGAPKPSSSAASGAGGQKTGLRKTQVAKGHFSVRDSKDDFSYTRFVVRVLKGTHLLASDIMTAPPTSDPICFGWVGFPEWDYTGSYGKPDEDKEWGSDPLTVEGSIEDAQNMGNSKDGLFRTTRCVPGTLNPVWDEELEFDVGALLKRDAQKRLFTSIRAEMDEQERQTRIQSGMAEPDGDLANNLKSGEPTEADFAALEVELDPRDTLMRILDLSCFLYVRDSDPAYIRTEGDIVPADISYDELGRVLLPLSSVVDKSRHANGALVTNCLKYPVKKTPGMPSMAMGTELGTLSLGCTLVLGNDAAGIAIKTALTPQFYDKKLDSRAFCAQLKKAQKGESLEIKPQMDLTGRRRTNSRSQSPTRIRSSLDQQRPNSSAASARLNGSSSRLNSSDGMHNMQNNSQRPNTSGGKVSQATQSRLDMRNSLDLSRVQESIHRATKVGEEVQNKQGVQPWKNKAAARYSNNDAADKENIQVLSNTPSLAEASGLAEEEGAAELPEGLSFGPSSGNEGANEGLPDDEPAASSTTEPEGAGAKAEEEGGEKDADAAAPATATATAADPELAGQESPKPADSTEGPIEGTVDDVSATVPDKDKDNDQASSPSATPVKSTPVKGKEPSASKIPRGGGSSAVKALRPSDDGEQSALVKTLSELKQLTQDSLKDLSGRMANLERKVEEATSPTRANRSAALASSRQNLGMSALSPLGPGPGGGDQSAPPITDAATKRQGRKNIRNVRNNDFKEFKQVAKENKRTKMQLDEANGHPRGSCDGPIMEFVHGSKLQHTISAARLGEDADPRGSLDRSRPMASSSSGNSSKGGGSGYEGGSGMPGGLGMPGPGDEGAAPGPALSSSIDAGVPMTQYHPAPGAPNPAPRGMGQPMQPLRLGAAPLPSNAPNFSSPDWGRVDVWLRAGDLVSAYAEVLDRGSPEDFGRLLTEGGIHPYALSATLLNRVCDMVSLILLQGSGQFTETCLLFILAVLRDPRIAESKTAHAAILLGRTKHALTEALTLLASKANALPSKQALLAGLLQAQLHKI